MKVTSGFNSNMLKSGSDHSHPNNKKNLNKLIIILLGWALQRAKFACRAVTPKSRKPGESRAPKPKSACTEQKLLESNTSKNIPMVILMSVGAKGELQRGVETNGSYSFRWVLTNSLVLPQDPTRFPQWRARKDTLVALWWMEGKVMF